MKFNCKIDELELRSCNEYLTLSGVHDGAEIVKWDSDGKAYCYTLAYWKRGEEGYDLLFVGNRPFEVNQKDFWFLANQGQKLLTEYFTEGETN